MIREIKFRSWLKERKEFIYDFIMDSIEDSEVEKRILSQYTGLKDQKGVEIYEGDILQFSGRVVACGIVKYNGNLCCFQACHKMSCWLICKESGVEFEIIGNIYENPELLEGANV